MYCMQCKQPSPDMKRAMEEEKAQRAMDEGRGGGLFDRQDPNDRNAWDSGDEDVDEFGRRKKKARAPAPKNGGAPKRQVASQLADKHKAALERLKNKHATSKPEEGSRGDMPPAPKEGERSRSRSRSRRRSRSRTRRRSRSRRRRTRSRSRSRRRR